MTIGPVGSAGLESLDINGRHVAGRLKVALSMAHPVSKSWEAESGWHISVVEVLLWKKPWVYQICVSNFLRGLIFECI